MTAFQASRGVMTSKLMIMTGLLVVANPLPRAASAEPPEAVDAAALARVRAYERARIDVIERVRPAVTCLFNRGNRAGGGSGVIIDSEGYGLTNFHVVAGMLEDRAGDAGLADGHIYEIEVLGLDLTGDVAMFKASGMDAFPTVTLGDSDALRLGDFTLAMGNPFLLAEDYTPTVTLGIVSGLRRYQAGAGDQGRALRYTDCIQVDTSINPGNSGGPLFDLSGALVGINGRVSIEERGRVNVGVGYAISINQIKRFIPMWRAGLTTKHATAGFTVMDRGRKVVVDKIMEDSPAYIAGVRLGDEVVSFANRPVVSANQFGSHLGVFPAGWPVEAVLRRKGETRPVRFKLEDLPLPKAPEGEGGMFGGPNPLGKHAVTDRANAMAVERALTRYRKTMGGKDAALGIQEIEYSGQRVVAERRNDPPARMSLTEKRSSIEEPSGKLTPVDMERSIRWGLLMDSKRKRRVVGADEIDSKIAVVIEEKCGDGVKYRVSFDDDTGDLLRIEFKDSFTGKKVRYEYGEIRRTGRIRWPFLRSTYLDGILRSVEEFQGVRVGAG
ncbi:MAG: trypsin-like peptidase domain-containing protein [Planctomycetes bacterium]|nr:trypsin-like peptidase domain-containing protein [Planctomycetota bacterium]